MVAGGSEPSHRSGGTPAAQLPCCWRHSACLRLHRSRCAHPYEASYAQNGLVLRRLYLRISDTAAASDLWARLFTSGCLRGHCNPRYSAASRAELVFGREARGFFKISSQAEENPSVRLASDLCSQRDLCGQCGIRQPTVDRAGEEIWIPQRPVVNHSDC